MLPTKQRSNKADRIVDNGNRHFLSKEASRQIATRVPRHPPSIGFVVQSTNRSLLGFEAQTGKPEPQVLRPNQEKPSEWF
jgi:hypothetical protein